MSSIFSTRITSYSSMCSTSVIVFSASDWACVPPTLDFRLLISTSFDSSARSAELPAAPVPSGWRNDDSLSRKSTDKMRLKLKTFTSAIKKR